MSDVQSLSDDDTLHLVKLREMLVVQALVAVDSRNGENPGFFVSRPSRGLDGYGCVVGSQHEPSRLFDAPSVSPTPASRLPSVFVGPSDPFHDALSLEFAIKPVLDIEGILQLSRGMILWGEESVKIPEGVLHGLARYLGEAHREVDLSHLVDKLP